MTCIVGLSENGTVYIGADSASASGWEVRASNTPKVFRRGPFIIGYTTSFRMGQILHYQVDLPEAETYDEEYMVTKFIEAIRTKFKELGFSKIDSNEETGGTFLVGVAGHIYEIADDFQVQSFADGICAIGCGSSYALGAMAALKSTPASDRIERALEIAEYFSGGVCGPFTVLASTEAANE
jgi:ATP-dependent protease HslVU (ClpYQ) peptidase subunit